MALQSFEQYAHSLVHDAIIRRDYAKLRHVLSMLPSLPKAGEVTSEEESAIAEEKADRVSAAIDRRDVPGRETPLHLAVRLGDAIAVEMLMAAGADWSLQNEQGWSALQEAVCAREEGIAMIITRHYQHMAWAKWCRRLPRITGAMERMRDFYMEITFNFESSVIPFVGRIAPSDTYRIWKQGSNLRADMTLAGFDGFKIQRANQSFLFLGEGTEDGKVSPGSLLVLSHKDKEVTNALEGAGVQPSEAEIAQEVAIMSETNMYRPGIDVTQAELVPQMNWRRQEKTEMVGLWKAKIFDMHHVLVSIRSRRVPGAMTDEELFAVEVEGQGNQGVDDYADILTKEEKQQLENALSIKNLDTSDDKPGLGEMDDHVTGLDQVAVLGVSDNAVEPMASSGHKQKRTRFRWGKKIEKQDESTSQVLSAGSGSELGRNGGADKLGASSSYKVTENHAMKQNIQNPQSSVRRKTNVENIDEEAMQNKKKVTNEIKDPSSNHKQASTSNGNHESEYKKGLRPVLWLTPDFPLKKEELLPLLDILADKVKAVRRLRELLTTKLPLGTFPVKVAIPIVPTIRVVVTFNKFEELSTAEEFCTPPSSPVDSPDEKGEEKSTWLSWLRGSQAHNGGLTSSQEENVDEVNPFVIPNDYTWIDMKEKKRRLKAKKAKSRKLPQSRTKAKTDST